MKRIILALLIFSVLSLSLFSCADEGGDGGNGSGEQQSSSLKLSATSEVITLGEGEVTLSVENVPEGNTDPVTYSIIGGDEGIATLAEDGVLSFTAIGAVTVKASVGESVTSNELTLVSINPDSTVGELTAAALSAPCLGDRLDIGIPPAAAHLYSVDGEGFVKINSDGRLELIGIRATGARIRLYRGEEKVYEGMYSMEASPFSVSVLTSLAADGVIPNIYADASAEKLASATSLAVTSTPLRGIGDYYALKYFTSLESLDLSGSPLYDLSFLDGLSTVKSLTLDNCAALEDPDGGLGFYNTLESLSALEHISMVGSFSCLDRALYNLLTSEVNRGSFTLELIDGVTLTPENVYPFSETVFFSHGELKAHLDKNGNVFTPAEGFSHAILALSGEKLDLSGYHVTAKTDALNLLELYGRSSATYAIAFEGAADSLTVNMYDFFMNLQNRYGVSGIRVGDDLNINALRGYCRIWGGNGSRDYASSAVAVSAYSKNVSLYAADGATLEIWGGSGYHGKDGVADGSNPYSTTNVTTTKWGGSGSDGSYGIRAKHIFFLSSGVNVYGGNGGNGGRGGDGTGVNIFNGGYDAGPGGNGGDGAQALRCESYTNEFSENRIVGGTGGSGGEGGNGYAAGIDGEDGDPGEYLGNVYYE